MLAVEFIVQLKPRRERIEVVLGSKLLRDTDGEPRRTKLNRSALIREALRAYLKNLDIRERERHDWKGCAGSPMDSSELSKLGSGGDLAGGIALGAPRAAGPIGRCLMFRTPLNTSGFNGRNVPAKLDSKF